MSRETVLGSIRRSLGVTGQETPRLEAVANRLGSPPTGVIPARGQGTRSEQLATFRQMAEVAQASLREVASADAVPAAVADFLRDANLPAVIRHGRDPRLAAMPWGETSLRVSTGRSDGSDLSAVSHATAGIAETATLVMTSGADNPTTLNFLPDNHIVVINASDIEPDYETMWARLRDKFGPGELPRTVNWITGPSRSADIEQTLLLGAHGPRRLHIILVNPAGL